MSGATPPTPDARAASWADRLAVFYDGDCGPCRAAMAWAVARDRDHRLEPIPLQSPLAAERLGPERLDRAAAELHVRSAGDGIRTGAAAVAAVLRRLPGWRWAGAALSWPPALALARPVYRLIAARRGGRRPCAAR